MGQLENVISEKMKGRKGRGEGQERKKKKKAIMDV